MFAQQNRGSRWALTSNHTRAVSRALTSNHTRAVAAGTRG